jgi:hypothetical protein
MIEFFLTRVHSVVLGSGFEYSQGMQTYNNHKITVHDTTSLDMKSALEKYDLFILSLVMEMGSQVSSKPTQVKCIDLCTFCTGAWCIGACLCLRHKNCQFTAEQLLTFTAAPQSGTGGLQCSGIRGKIARIKGDLRMREKGGCLAKRGTQKLPSGALCNPSGEPGR